MCSIIAACIAPYWSEYPGERIRAGSNTNGLRNQAMTLQAIQIRVSGIIQGLVRAR
ncbi:hypothetical protein C7212DRAFT_306074 [Tuber magnatum]|uniref:Uncharacterized protein n=1 Tax=Tuber magnatum TaxID=42249 RepID=A0A317T418_9PEZI|nr:hypothetical protein C7212DRAFT_306074 [Tuber magnatum]